jgi:hypothetical protein
MQRHGIYGNVDNWNIETAYFKPFCIMNRKYTSIALVICILVSGCTRPNLPLPGNQVLTLYPASFVSQADNYTYLKITATATAGSNLSNRYRNVLFTAGSGSFQATNSTTYSTTFDGNGNAVAFLKNNIPGPVTITASDDTVATSIIVNFISAWPQSINLSPATSTLKNDTSSAPIDMVISAQLLRDSGTVSSNIIVKFYATDASGNNRGTFFNVTPTNTSGVATASYGLQDTATIQKNRYKGIINLRAEVMINNKDSIPGSNKILVIY